MKKYVVTIVALLMCVVLTGCCRVVESLPIWKKLPPAGTYAVSSIGTEDGDMVIYGTETDEIMMIAEDGTGTFYFNGTLHSISFDENALNVDDWQTPYSYIPASSQDDPLLMLYWFRDDVNSIALRPVS